VCAHPRCTKWRALRALVFRESNCAGAPVHHRTVFPASCQRAAGSPAQSSRQLAAGSPAQSSRQRAAGSAAQGSRAAWTAAMSPLRILPQHSSGGSRPSTRQPTKQRKRLADAHAAVANGQPARGRHAPRCAPADARSAGRGSGLAALPRPSQCRPEKGPVEFFKIGTRWAARRRGPAHALWCCAQGSGAAACEARLVSAARGLQRAQQGGARALSSSSSSSSSSSLPDSLHDSLHDFRKGKLGFSAQKNINNTEFFLFSS